MSWFKRSDKKIVTPTKDKKETPDGLWYKTPKGDLIETKVLEQNNFVTPDEGFHTRIGSKQYFEIIFDTNKYQTIAPELQPGDPLTFEDTKKDILDGIFAFIRPVITSTDGLCVAIAK